MSGRNVTHERHQGNLSEHRIMSRWDRGMTLHEIADDLKMSFARVRTVVSHYCVNNDDQWQSPARIATDQLAQRIIEIHGRRAA